VVKQHWENNKGRALNYAGADIDELENALKESMKTFKDEDEGSGMVG
jgi:hypothetical protein